jgi:hypothetical protein
VKTRALKGIPEKQLIIVGIFGQKNCISSVHSLASVRWFRPKTRQVFT